MYAEDSLLPLSGLAQLAFCQRRWALIHLERQWADNLFTAQGGLLHEKAHSGSVESRPDALIRRTLPLRSFRLGLSGQSDIVEFLPAPPGEPGVRMPRRGGLWRPYPVEFKRSRDKHGGASSQLQLCAQALCLEEMLETPVPRGAVFDGTARRRFEIEFTPALRAAVEDMAARMHGLWQSAVTPPPERSRKCESCSLKPLCLPAATARSASAYLRSAVGGSLRWPPISSAAGDAQPEVP